MSAGLGEPSGAVNCFLPMLQGDAQVHVRCIEPIMNEPRYHGVST
jgi:hypothetical protein